MTLSMFDVMCPTCRVRLVLLPTGDAHCTDCAESFLVRLGHVVPQSAARRTLDTGASS